MQLSINNNNNNNSNNSSSSSIISFYTDGACSSKDLTGGWAMIGISKDQIIYFENGNEEDTTNNRMELKAFLSAMKTINEIGKKVENERITIYDGAVLYTDSAYIANCINQKWYVKWQANGWRRADKQVVKNQDLWKEILVYYIRIINRSNFSFEVKKVEAHSNNEWNNIVDKIAVNKRLELSKNREEA